jgi:Multiubiquitin
MKTDEKRDATEGKEKLVEITVTVNNKPVTFDRRKVTGLEIKDTAIAQGVNIQRNFVLYQLHGQGKPKPVGDAEEVTLNRNDAFRAVTPDDNS